MAVRLRLVHPVPTRIGPGNVTAAYRRGPRLYDERPGLSRTSDSPSRTRLAVSPPLPHRANAISSPPARPYPALKAPSIAGHDIEDDNGDGWTLLRRAIHVESGRHARTREPLHADMTAFLVISPNLTQAVSGQLSCS